MSVWCVVVAAGRGVRAGLGMNKVYAKLEGRSVLSRCLDALAASEVFDGIVLVISAEDEALYRELCESEGAQPLVKLRRGGISVPGQENLVHVRPNPHGVKKGSVEIKNRRPHKAGAAGLIGAPLSVRFAHLPFIQKESL